MQFMTVAEMVEETHRNKGEPTYQELKEQRDNLVHLLEIYMENASFEHCHPMDPAIPDAAIAKAKGIK